MPQVPPPEKNGPNRAEAHIRLGKYQLRMPQSRAARIAIGLALLAGGMLFFLPVLGLWMLPLGLLVLSAEFAVVRRWRRKLALWWGRRGAIGPGRK